MKFFETFFYLHFPSQSQNLFQTIFYPQNFPKPFETLQLKRTTIFLAYTKIQRKNSKNRQKNIRWIFPTRTHFSIFAMKNKFHKSIEIRGNFPEHKRKWNENRAESGIEAVRKSSEVENMTNDYVLILVNFNTIKFMFYPQHYVFMHWTCSFCYLGICMGVKKIGILLSKTVFGEGWIGKEESLSEFVWYEPYIMSTFERRWYYSRYNNIRVSSVRFRINIFYYCIFVSSSLSSNLIKSEW